MKRLFAMMIAGTSMVAMLAGCGAKTTETAEPAETEATATEATEAEAEVTDAAAETVKIDKLTIGFVPSREPDEIVTATEPLKELLTAELATQGYEVGEVDITVGTSYEAVGEGLSAGTIDIGLIPGGTLYFTRMAAMFFLQLQEMVFQSRVPTLRFGTMRSLQLLQKSRLLSTADLSLLVLQRQVRLLQLRLTTAKSLHGKILMALTGA